MAETDLTTDPNAAIGEAMGDLLDGLSGDDAISDDLLDAELDAKHGTTVADDLDKELAPTKETDDVAPVVEADDPLKGAVPFDYTVDGQAKSFDGIKVLKGPDGTIQGAVIEPAAFKDVQARLSKADYYETANKALYAKSQEYERAGGIEKLQAQATENAKLSEVVKYFAEHLDFDKPEKLIALAYAAQNGDKSEFDRLIERTAFIADRAAFTAQQNWGKAQTQATEHASSVEQRQQITENSISTSVQQWAQQFPALTQDDLQKAVAHFTRIGSAVVRPASPEEARTAGVTPGSLVIDHPVIHEWLSDRAQLRQQQIDATKTAQTASQENAKRLAAAQRGKTSQPSKTRRPANATVPASPEGETWQQQKERLMSGGYTASDD